MLEHEILRGSNRFENETSPPGTTPTMRCGTMAWVCAGLCSNGIMGGYGAEGIGRIIFPGEVDQVIFCFMVFYVPLGWNFLFDVRSREHGDGLPKRIYEGVHGYRVGPVPSNPSADLDRLEF
jgi:hypothetical protein